MEDLLTYSEQLILDQEQEDKLIEQSKENPQKFRLLYVQYFKRIFLFILNRVRNEQDAADITSQVFYKALTNLKKYENRGLPFSSWLYRIAINESNAIFNKRGKIRYISITKDIYNQLTEELFIELNNEKKNRLNKALMSLKPSQLELIELRFFENMSFREIGDVLSITENNAKVRLYRVLDQMRKKI